MSKRSGFLFVAFLVVAAIIVLIVLNRNAVTEPTNTNVSADQNMNVDESTFQPVVSEDGVYSLLQPAERLEVGEITTYTFAAGQLSVMPAAMQSVVLNETPIQAEVNLVVSGLPAKRYTLASAKDGSSFDVVQVLHLGQVYHFLGAAAFLDNLDSYIRLNNNE